MRQRRGSVVTNLLIVNALVYFLVVYISPGLYDGLALYGVDSPNFRPWQLLTHMFVHDQGNFWHLFTNMFTLWMFGRQIEWDMGSKRFMLYYLVCGLGAAILQMVVNAAMGVSPNVAMVGASGAVYGILLAFGMLHGNTMIMLLIPPIPMKAKWFVIIFGVLELILGLRGGDGIAHFAHLGGILFGLLMILRWRKRHVL